MTAEARQTMNPEAVSGAILARVESLTLVFGILGTAWMGWRLGWHGAAGAVLGVALSWINFRWLKGSVRSFGSVAASVPAPAADGGSANVHSTTATPARAVVIPATGAGKSASFKFIGRYVLLLGGVYVILTRTSLPALSVFVGLFAVPAGVVAAAVYELVSSGIRQAVSPNS